MVNKAITKKSKLVKATHLYNHAEWRKSNPLEADIMDLITAAKKYADSQVQYSAAESGDPEDPPGRVDDTATDLEMAIGRAELAIRAMMVSVGGRKAAGLKRLPRGKANKPEQTRLVDPQVQIVLKMIRGEKDPEEAAAEVAKIIDPSENIGVKTLNEYIEGVKSTWGRYADPNYKGFWAEAEPK
jgi:hypothetical protein